MEKKEDHGLKKQSSELKHPSREYLHSLSRIGDRLKVLQRDLVKMREEVNRDLTYMEEDVNMLVAAFDSLFEDHLISVHDENANHKTEEI